MLFRSFSNLIAAPDASDQAVAEAVNDTLKAIAASLLMEQVLAPRFEFKPKNPDNGPAPGFDYGPDGYDPDRSNVGVNHDTIPGAIRASKCPPPNGMITLEGDAPDDPARVRKRSRDNEAGGDGQRQRHQDGHEHRNGQQQGTQGQRNDGAAKAGNGFQREAQQDEPAQRNPVGFHGAERQRPDRCEHRLRRSAGSTLGTCSGDSRSDGAWMAMPEVAF